MLAAIVLAAQLICQDCNIYVSPRESPTDRAMREFQQRQDRIKPRESPVDRASKDFRDRQRRLECANHPDQC